MVRLEPAREERRPRRLTPGRRARDSLLCECPSVGARSCGRWRSCVTRQRRTAQRFSGGVPKGEERVYFFLWRGSSRKVSVVTPQDELHMGQSSHSSPKHISRGRRSHRIGSCRTREQLLLALPSGTDWAAVSFFRWYPSLRHLEARISLFFPLKSALGSGLVS